MGDLGGCTLPSALVLEPVSRHAFPVPAAMGPGSHASFCSIMFGATTEFFFRHLLGIQQAEHSRGYKHVVFRPSVLLSPAHLAICANLSSVQGTLLRPHGEISASWACDSDTAVAKGIAYNVSVPIGVAATVDLPLSAQGAKTIVKESDIIIWDGAKQAGHVAGVTSVTLAQDSIRVQTVGAGQYRFRTQ